MVVAEQQPFTVVMSGDCAQGDNRSADCRTHGHPAVGVNCAVFQNMTSDAGGRGEAVMLSVRHKT